MKRVLSFIVFVVILAMINPFLPLALAALVMFLQTLDDDEPDGLV